MEAVFAQWAAICALGDEAAHLFSEQRGFQNLYRTTFKIIRNIDTLPNGLFAVLLRGVCTLIKIEYAGRFDAMEFLFELVLSPVFLDVERALLIQSTKIGTPEMMMLFYAKSRIISSIEKVMKSSETDDKETLRVLQILELVVSSIGSRSIILLLMYSSFLDLLNADENYLRGVDLSASQIDNLVNRRINSDKAVKKANVSVFVSEQVRSNNPLCRGYAYRILGLVSMRCFDILGEKVVGQLLLKRRFQETADNRIIITVILWNLLFIWPEFLEHVLIAVEDGVAGHGQPVTCEPDSLLNDLWETSVNRESATPQLRSACIISAARTTVSGRFATQQMNAMLLRELALSFLLRSSVESAVKNTISEARSVTSVAVETTKRSKKSVKVEEHDGTNHTQHLDNLYFNSSAMSCDKVLTTLCGDDADDLGVIKQLAISGSQNGALNDPHTKMLIVEILSVVLKQSLRTSLVTQKSRRKEGSANDPRLMMNIMYFRQSICHWISLVRSIFFSGLHQESARLSDCAQDAFELMLDNMRNDETLQNIADGTLQDIYQAFSEAVKTS